MMQSTCTVQVNLDVDSEQTMVEMFRISLALQPVATAIWANSPFKNGKPNGFLSYRSHIWTDTDNDRCGTIPFVFEDGFGFERYVDYILDVSNQGLLIPPGIWASQTYIDNNSSLLVLCDQPFSEADYIRNYDEYLQYREDIN